MLVLLLALLLQKQCFLRKRTKYSGAYLLIAPINKIIYMRMSTRCLPILLVILLMLLSKSIKKFASRLLDYIESVSFLS